MVKTKQETQQPGGPTCILGVDPGLDGGLALIRRFYRGHQYVESCEVFSMPTWTALVRRTRRRYFDSYQFSKLINSLDLPGTQRHVAVEAVHASPQMGVSSAFSFGRTYGGTLGVLAAAGFTIHDIEPTVWKRKFGLSASKVEAISKAKEIFPHTDFRNKDGLAEAALIGYYAINNMDLKVDPLS